MPKSVALSSFRDLLSSVDEQIFSAEEQAELIRILETSKLKKSIDVKREEHFELLSDLIALRAVIGKRHNAANREVNKRIETFIKKEKAAGTKVVGQDRARAALASDEEASGWLDFLEDAEVIVATLDRYLEAFKQRSFAIHEESIETRKFAATAE